MAADVGDANSIESPLGDSDEVRGDGKWFPRDFGLPATPPNGLRGGASKIVLIAPKGFWLWILSGHKRNWMFSGQKLNSMAFQR